MEKLKFSVSMCVYGKDNPAWFETAVESVLNQKCMPDEVVLVVDGPVPDELDNIIKKYEEKEMFNVIRLETNMGHGEARRIGLDNCKNNLVALMDADDICLPDRFEKQIAMFEKDEELSIVGGNITEFIDTPENIVAKRLVPSEDKEIKEYLKIRCPMNQVTVVFKKDCVGSVGGYIDWYCEEDYYLWIRMSLAGMKFANLPDILVNVRVGADMYQRRGGIRYFKSEAKLQKLMLDEKIIGIGTYFSNVLKRLIVQVLLPNKIRGWIFKKIARKMV
ncbi:MAG: glycosyltransferase [Clostridia bacterium]|nr:glycosyltransferase [Clostridia bacterium]